MLDEEEQLKYSIGGLLYVPAMNKKLPQKVREKKFPNLTSLAFCLEDTIKDEYLEEAELSLNVILGELKKLNSALPLIFIRIRTPEHMRHVYELYQDYRDIITGYILPKFDLSNMDGYISLIRKINGYDEKKIYIMPILESRMVADIVTRYS